MSFIGPLMWCSVTVQVLNEGNKSGCHYRNKGVIKAIKIMVIPAKAGIHKTMTVGSRSFDLAQDKLRGNDKGKRCLLKIYFCPT